jgi:diguanylate cyclase (GGDEF)-like protein/PAS domain S-box-containing protein
MTSDSAAPPSAVQGLSGRLRVLVLEDLPSDAALLSRELRRAMPGVVLLCTASERQFRDALVRFRPDLILSDYTLPHYNAMFALRHAREALPGIPFIVVTGSISEEVAVECMKAGANDYVLKTHLIRIGPAVAAALERQRAQLEKERAQAALRESEERYAVAARGANDGLWDWNLLTGEVYYSPRWKAMLGYQEHEIGTDLQEWLGRLEAGDRERVRAEIDAHLVGTLAHLECEYRILHKDGEYRFMLNRSLAVRDETGRACRLAGSQTDITRRKQAEERLLHDALHDALTGLPNRTLFLDRLRQRLARSERGDASFAVVYLDLDRFKVVNDSLGHAFGDRLLIAVAERLGDCVRPGDSVARFGGDEFTMLLDGVKDVGEAVRVAERIQRDLKAPVRLDDREFFTTASAGIALGAGYTRAEDVVRDADTAMYRAKAGGRGRREVFDATMHARAVSILQLETDLHRALEREEFRVHYQPIVAFDDRRIVGFEALVRWQHPERGLLNASEFVPAAEEAGLIVPIGQWVLREACRCVREWQQRPSGGAPPSISVNLSAREFGQPHLVQRVGDALSAVGLAANRLRIEITESMIMQEAESAVWKLRALKDLGVGLDIDDFGTGYSSLSYLRRFPIDALKIDRSFVSRMRRQREDREIVRTIVALAGALGLGAMAEGVETAEQASELAGLHCDYGQGFLFAKPVDGAAALAMIA